MSSLFNTYPASMSVLCINYFRFRSVPERSASHAFTIEVWWNIDKMQIINRKFQSRLLVGKNSTALYGDDIWHWSSSLGKISPGKGTYYGTLRCRTLPSKENFPKQWPALWFLQQISLSPIECCTFLPTKGRDRNFLLWHLIKIPSHLDCESINKYTVNVENERCRPGNGS